MNRFFGPGAGLTNQPVGLDVGIPAGGGSPIKSIQSGIGTIAAAQTIATVPISSVDPNKSIIIGSWLTVFGVPNVDAVSAEITDATTLTFRRNTSNATWTGKFYYQVIEFTSVKSLQKGFAASAAVTQNITISAVNLNKAICFVTYTTTLAAAQTYNIAFSLTSATNLQVTKFDATSTTAYWQVVELP